MANCAEERAALQRRLGRVVTALENGTIPSFKLKTHWGQTTTFDLSFDLRHVRQYLGTLTPSFVKELTVPGEDVWSYTDTVIYATPNNIQPMSEMQTGNLVADSGYF